MGRVPGQATTENGFVSGCLTECRLYYEQGVMRDNRWVEGWPMFSIEVLGQLEW